MRVLTYEKLDRYRDYDSFEVGGTPHSEECTQANPDDFHVEDSKLESEVYARQLERLYGAPPDGCELFLMKNYHTFGVYYEVAVLYKTPPDKNNESEQDEAEWPPLEYALKLEAGCEKWDAIAISELKEAGHHLHIPKAPAKVVKHQGKVINLKSETA